MSLDAVYDDAADLLTVTATARAPEPPPGVRLDLWYPQAGVTVEFSLPVRRGRVSVPVARYRDPVDGRLYEVRYVGGAWDMPGTAVG